MKEMVRESGDHSSSPSSPGVVVTRRGEPPPPAAGITKMSVSLRSASSRLALYGSLPSESRSARTAESERSRASAVKAIHCPSGETVTSGCEKASLLSCFFAPPAVGRIQIWLGW